MSGDKENIYRMQVQVSYVLQIDVESTNLGAAIVKAKKQVLVDEGLDDSDAETEVVYWSIV